MKDLTMSVGSLNDLALTEAIETEVHRARQGLINFKAYAFKVMDSGKMTHGDFLILNASAIASEDYMDALTLNKLTVLFAIAEEPLH